MSDVVVLAYFADDPTRVYQLAQWLPVLEVLHEQHPVGIVVARPRRRRSPVGGGRGFPSSPGTVVPRADRALRRARRQGRALLQQLDAQLPVARRRPRCCTCTSTTARATSRAWRATTPRPTTGSSSPARPPCSATAPASWSSTPAGWCASDARSSTCARTPLLRPSDASDGPLRAHLGGRRRLQRLHLGRHRSAPTSSRAILGRPRRTPRLQAAPQGHHQPDAGRASATRTARSWTLVAAADAARARRRPHGRSRAATSSPSCPAATPWSPTSPRSASTGSTCAPTSRSSSPTGTTTPTGSARRCRSAAAPTSSTSTDLAA